MEHDIHVHCTRYIVHVQFSRLGIQVSLAAVCTNVHVHVYMYVCLSGLWLGGSLHHSFLSDFVLCTCISMYILLTNM